MDMRGAIWLPEHMARGSMRVLPRPPVATPDAYITFAMLRPRGTHFQDATCEDVDCPDFLNGFVLSIDTSTDIGQKQFHYVTHDRSRRYSMQRTGQTMFKFVYGPGNDGFGHKHKAPLDRMPKLLAVGGDWRGQTSEPRFHKKVEDWVDHSMTVHDRNATLLQRG